MYHKIPPYSKQYAHTSRLYKFAITLIAPSLHSHEPVGSLKSLLKYRREPVTNKQTNRQTNRKTAATPITSKNNQQPPPPYTPINSASASLSQFESSPPSRPCPKEEMQRRAIGRCRAKTLGARENSRAEHLSRRRHCQQAASESLLTRAAETKRRRQSSAAPDFGAADVARIRGEGLLAGAAPRKFRRILGPRRRRLVRN